MNRTFFEELPARKAGGPVVSANTQKSSDGEGGNTEEKSAKRIRQAVYDIRYRARREDIDLKAAYSQYMGNTTMTGPEKDAVKQKLFGEAYSPIQKQIIANREETIKKMKRTFEGPHHDQNKYGEPVEEETKGEGPDKKYKIRVTDKASGRTYIRFATREKINSLRANPNIKSVEMTEYGQAYEGEAKKGEQTAATKSGKGLDPVGKEDKDVDNDGDHDKSDKYLLKRRAAIGKAMASRNEEVEQINEKPGDGYIMGTGIPFPGERAAHTRRVNRKYDDLVRGSQDAARGRRRLHSGGALRPTSVGSPEYEAGYRNPGKYKPIEVKNSYEPEGESIDELAPIVAVPLAVGAGYAIHKGIEHFKKKSKKAIDDARNRSTLGGHAFGGDLRMRGGVQRNSYEPEGEVLEAAPIPPHTNVKYDKHMKQYVPVPGGVAVPRASGGPALPGEPGRPGSGKKGGRPLLPGESPVPLRLAKKKANIQMAGYEPEGEVLEAAVPHTNVYYDKHMKRFVPMGGGTAVPRASKKPDKKSTTQVAHYELEGEEISEREMTAGEKKKEGRLKDKYDESGMKSSMKKQYGAEKGKQVYFATIRKQAMKESIASRSRRKELEKELEGREGKGQLPPFTTGKGAKPYHTKKESTQFYDWRTQFLEQMGNEIDPQTKEKVTEKNFRNRVVINPKQGTTSN